MVLHDAQGVAGVFHGIAGLRIFEESRLRNSLSLGRAGHDASFNKAIADGAPCEDDV